jgi:hypothetical protein
MLLPDTIPCAFGGLSPPPAPVPGNGYEVQVFAHTDFRTPVCVVPRFTSLQFAKVLKDKGSGTIGLALDDPALFPPGAISLNTNPLFAGGDITGWQSINCPVAEPVTTAPAGGTQPWSLLLQPDGASQLCYISGSAAPFAVIPGQRYVVSAGAYLAAGPPSGSRSIALGMVFLDAYANATLVFTDLQVPTSPAAWQPLLATATAPAGSITGYPLAGFDGTAPATDALYLQAVAATYESTQEPGTPGSAALGDYLLDYEHLWVAYQDGRKVFEFTGQTVTEQLDDETEQRIATITGPGTATVLSWAAAMPPGFPEVVFKTDAIADGFAEVDQWGNLQLDTALWNLCSGLDWPYPPDGTTGNPADPNSVDPNSLVPSPGNTYGNETVGRQPVNIDLNPPGTCQITAIPAGTFLGATPYDITSSSISAQITPMIGGSLDGSQITQFYVQDTGNPGNYALIGLSGSRFYCQLGDTVAGGSPVTNNLSAYSASSDLYWRISERNGIFYFWTSADGQTWVQRWSTPYRWDAASLDFFITATYDQPGGAFVAVTNINAEIITPSSAGNIFLLTPIMGVWHKLLLAAQQRGTIPQVTTKLNGQTDSFGNPWKDAMSVQIQNGTDLFSLLGSHAAIVNADWVMQPGFNLQVGLPVSLAGGVSLGRDLSRAVVVRESASVTANQRVRARDQVANLIGGVNSDGTVVSASDAVSIATYQQREGWVQTAQAVNSQSMQVVVGASLAQTKSEVRSETLSILPFAPGATPFEDFDVGDWVGKERPGIGASITDAVRVVGIAIGVDATGMVTCELTINTYRQFLSQQLQYLINKFGGQFVNSLGTVPVTSTGSPGSTPTVTAPALGGLSDVVTGTQHLDPLVWNALAAVWQNASNSALSGAPLGLAIGTPATGELTMDPAPGWSVTVDGGTAGQVPVAYWASSGAASELVPGAVVPVVWNAGAANEQLGLLLVSGTGSRPGRALLLQGTSADGTLSGAARAGRISQSGTTWAFTTTGTL